MRRWPILTILLLAYGLSVVGLSDMPPGLTHDEAAHGWEALQVLGGEFRYYFPLGYGREPLYAYLLAGTMKLIGVSPFTLRLVIPWAMIYALAGGYSWSRREFGRPAALLTSAFWAVGFWPIAVSRQALRSGLLPLLLVLMAIGVTLALKPAAKRKTPSWQISAILALTGGLMLHTYIAARVLWILPLLFWLALWIVDRDRARISARPLLLGTLGGLVLGAPLMIFLQLNPGLESRLDMLSRPLTALLDGDVWPLVNNSWASLKALAWPGAGDYFLAYNIPGRPTLEITSALLAVLGLGVVLWRWRQPPYLYLLLWLGVGLAPSLITGPTANTTRNIGALPPLYALVGIGGWVLIQRLPRGWWRPAVGVILITAAAGQSSRDYFAVWQTSPDVRAAYQSTIIAALDEIEQTIPPDQPLMISSVYPGPAHDPLIGDLVLGAGDRPLRWVDARRALLFPAGNAVEAFVPSAADLHPLFASWSTVKSQTNLPAGELDPLITHYQIAPPPLDNVNALAEFEGAITLLSAEWLADNVPPGGVAEMMTVWQIESPAVWPAAADRAPDLAIFVHVLADDGEIFTQEDRLDAPFSTWRSGDLLVQIHQLYLPPETTPGDYRGRLGMYERGSEQRLMTAAGEDFMMLPALQVSE
ncbi:MAG: glycosyltransferase family 39 protein [Ardenticatenaceae bacterium]|nr:glycosyltransferase family 39 protein [Ardenticatenaceae bacterium]